MFVSGSNKQLAGSSRCSGESDNSIMIMSLLCVINCGESLGFGATARCTNPCQFGSKESFSLLCRVNLEIQLHSTRPVGIIQRRY